MFEHVASFRSRLVAAFLATALFVVPAVAQTIIIEVDHCFWYCHGEGKKMYDYLSEHYRWMGEGDKNRAANIVFVDCMEENCGGM